MTISTAKQSMYTLPATTHPGRVHVRVADLERALGFYRDLLGYVVQPLDERRVRLAPTTDAPTNFLLEEVLGVPPKPWRNAGLYHTAIRVPTRYDLACVIGRLLNNGWKIGGMADHGVSEAFYLADADGNGIEIERDRPRAAWPVRDGTTTMVTDPLDVKSLFKLLQPGDLERISMPAGSDIGHVHLQVSNLDRTEAFYCDILGFDIRSKSDQALFVSAGGYHHHLGTNTWAGEDVPALRDDVAGLIDFSLVLPNEAALDELVARVEAAGLPLQTPGPGESSAGVLIHDPDGIGVVLTVASEEKNV